MKSLKVFHNEIHCTLTQRGREVAPLLKIRAQLKPLKRRARFDQVGNLSLLGFALFAIPLLQASDEVVLVLA